MMRGDDKGAALLTVLLLVAVMAALIALSFDRVSLAIQRERNRASSEEIRLDLISAEAIAVNRITQLTASGAKAADWMGRKMETPIPGGRIRARMLDGGNCFNLNALVTQNPQGGYDAKPVAVAQFERLLALSGATANEAATLAQASADWIDSDTSPLPGGKEDADYARLKSPYRTGNTLMVSVSEWRAVAGVTPQMATRVEPLLCALPDTALPQYNVNSLTAEQAPLLAALLPGLSVVQVAQALQFRPAAGFDSAQALLSQPSLRGNAPSGEAAIQLQTQTQWFRLDLVAQLGEVEMNETAWVDARARPARLVRRELGERY